MKKIYGFLAAAAILSMAACSKEHVSKNDVPEATKGDMFMTMTISPSSATGTRTATPNQSQGEVGKDRENTISNALIIFAQQGTTEGNYTVVTSIYAGTDANSEILPSVSGDQVMANFKVDRNTILKAINGSDTPATEGEKKFYLFVVANAPSALAGKFTPNADVQQTFETTGDVNTYWTVDNFLMSNAELYEKTIKAADIQPGMHTESTNAYPLNEEEKPVKIQRAMSRFDLATGGAYTKFTATTTGREDDNLQTPNSDIKDLTIEFDAVALINMASSANTFKVTAADAAAVSGKTIVFGTESKTNWVVSPTQTNFWTPLFDGAVSAGKLTGDSKNLASFFTTTATESSTNAAVNRVGGYTLISSITEADNDYIRPGGAPNDLPAYSIWRYCMENTNPWTADGQVNGNSTGVVFRAKMTGKKVDGTAITSEDGPLYAYGNVILGNAEGLWDYATSPKSEDDESNVYAAVKLKYDVIIQAYLDANKKEPQSGEWDFDRDGYESTEEGTDWFETKAADFETSGKYEIHHGDLDELKAELVASGFTVYEPEGDTYYCYYIYWNRHNDNGNNSTMGAMEFATVRNNVYKLRVSKIHKLGHPGKSEDDPDDPTPDTPDETDSFYCEIICEILPWEVRINDIEF